jgi:predicted ribosomally synthesized peptide with nif11-like leader
MELNTSRPLQAMSEEQLKAFLEAVKVDVGLQEQLKEAKDMDSVVAIAKAAGFVISVEELNKAQAELSEEELEGMAGGMTPAFVGLLVGTFIEVTRRHCSTFEATPGANQCK